MGDSGRGDTAAPGRTHGAGLLTVADVAALLGISRSAVYVKIRLRSLRPVAQSPWRFAAADVAAYRATQARGQRACMHGRPTAMQVLHTTLARAAPAALPMPALRNALAQVGLGLTWRQPTSTCCVLLRRIGARRIRQGWYVLDTAPRRRPMS